MDSINSKYNSINLQDNESHNLASNEINIMTMPIENLSISGKQKTNIYSCEINKKFIYEIVEMVTNCNSYKLTIHCFSLLFLFGQASAATSVLYSLAVKTPLTNSS